MGWFIHHVNIEAHDVPQSVAFYRDILGLKQGEWNYPEGAELGLGADQLAVFGTYNRGIHIVRPPFPHSNTGELLLLNQYKYF